MVGDLQAWVSASLESPGPAGGRKPCGVGPALVRRVLDSLAPADGTNRSGSDLGEVAFALTVARSGPALRVPGVCFHTKSATGSYHACQAAHITGWNSIRSLRTPVAYAQCGVATMQGEDARRMLFERDHRWAFEIDNYRRLGVFQGVFDSSFCISGFFW